MRLVGKIIIFIMKLFVLLLGATLALGAIMLGYNLPELIGASEENYFWFQFAGFIIVLITIIIIISIFELNDNIN